MRNAATHIHWPKNSTNAGILKFKRAINDFIHEFDKRHHKIKYHRSIISDDLLAFRLLKAANLPSADEKLAKGTSELTYISMKDQLNKLFSESNSFAPGSTGVSRFEDINIHVSFG